MTPASALPPEQDEPTRIPLAAPSIGRLERDYVVRAVDSGFVSSIGPCVSEFERNFAEKVGANYAVACSSGTAAIHIALLVLGVLGQDEVFCSDFTFVGSVNPVAYTGARLTLVDSESKTWNMDHELLEKELARRLENQLPMPKVIEVVHALGQPADMAPIMEICERFKIAVLEDAAESLGATWTSGRFAGRHTGTVGNVGCFSFNGNKIATTGGGGMIITNSREMALRARHLSTQAKVKDVGYLHDEVGYNYRMTNLTAALGLAQLERLDEFVAKKRQIAARYDEGFAHLPLIVPPRIEGYRSTYWLYSVMIAEASGQRRDELLAYLAHRNIEARALWRPVSAQPPFAMATVLGGKVGTDLFNRGLSLPCSTDLRPAEQQRVISAVGDFFAVSDGRT